MGQALKSSIAEARQEYWNDATDFSLLASEATKRVISGALETMQQMLICIAAEEPCDWTWMQVILEHEFQNFRYFARQDLGIDA